MKKIQLRYLIPAAVLLICGFTLLRPVAFDRFANTGEATLAYLSANPSGMGVDRRWTAEAEELAEVLALLKGGTLHFRGGSRSVRYDAGQWLYRFRLVHEEGGQWAQDAYFALRSDGMLYNVWPNHGYWVFRLKDADMGALNALMQGRWEEAAG